MNKTDTQFWTKYFKVYDTLNEFIPYQDLIKDVVAAVDPQPGDVILDAGCGTGNVAIELSKRGADVIGFDNVPAALDRYKHKDPNAETIMGDLTAPLPFGDGQFDKVVCVNTLYTLDTKAQIGLAREMSRVVGWGGKVIVCNITNNISPLKLFVYGIWRSLDLEGFIKTIIHLFELFLPSLQILKYNLIISKKRNFHFYSISKLIQMFEEVGFETESEAYNLYGGQAAVCVFQKKYVKSKNPNI